MNACKLVGVSRRTIYNWIASGKVEYVRTAGGSVRIFVDTLWREPETDSSQLTSAQPDAMTRPTSLMSSGAKPIVMINPSATCAAMRSVFGPEQAT